MSNKNTFKSFENSYNSQKAPNSAHPKNRKNNKSLENEPENEIQINSKEINDCLEKFIKGKDIKEFIPSKLRNNPKAKKVEEMKLNLGSKAFIPSKYKLMMCQKEEKEEKKEIKKQKPEKKECIFSYEYLMQFKTMEICNNTDLLTSKALNHIKEIEEKLEEIYKVNNKNEWKSSRKSSSANESCSLEQWARKDFTKEINIAEQNIKKFTEIDKENNTIKELRALTNIMTKDNYDTIKPKIIDILKEDVKIQEQYLEIFIKKALEGKLYIELYGKLCKDLNKALPQKSKQKEKSKNTSSIFRDMLIDKVKDIMKSKNFDNYIKEENPEEKKLRIMKFYLADIDFLFELIKIKMLSKKIIPDIVNFLFERYKNEKDNENFMKSIYARALISFSGEVGELVYRRNEKMKLEDVKHLKEKLEDFFEKLEKIQNDQSLPQSTKYHIINLVEKKKKNFAESKFEKSLKAKSKKELEDELRNKIEEIEENEEEKEQEEKEKEKEEAKEEEKDEENKEEEQQIINEQIKKDLNEYKEFVEEEGNSKKYPWKITTILYDKEFKALDDILEAFLIGSADFIDMKDNNNITYAKDYIKELIEYYNDKITDDERENLQKRAFDLFNLVKDFAFETPKIYDVYSHLLFIFIKNDIINIEDLENIFEKEPNEDDISILNKVFKNIYEYNKSESFKNELKKFGFIYKNKGLFDWVF